MLLVSHSRMLEPIIAAEDYIDKLHINLGIVILSTDTRQFLDELSGLLDRYAMTRIVEEKGHNDYKMKVDLKWDGEL